jgi:signal transduction histidine kinase
MAGVSRPATLRHSLARLFLAAGLVMTLVVVAGAVAVVRLSDDRDEVTNRIDPANVLVANLLAAYLDQETGIRGYVLTRQPLFLQPYQAGQTSVGSEIARLDKLLPQGSRAALLLAQVEQAAGDWTSQFARPAVAAIAAGDDRFASDSALARSKTLFDNLRAAITALQTNLAQEGRAARHRLVTAADVLAAVLLASVGVLVATAVAIWRSLRRRVTVPLSEVAEDARLVAGGDLDHQVRVNGPREISDLASGVEAMRRRILDDVDAARATQETLIELNADLARSNEELEQFAYVASHDLQEPLRKVTSFCQLLEQRYGGQLDDRAVQYIDFAVDGAKRMQVLINDLLAFSRIGRTTDHFEPVRLQVCVELAERNLAVAIEDTGARITVTGDLPTVNGDRTLLGDLLQNLLSNAIKFRSDRPPTVRISASREGDDWVVAVEDRGIGIEPRFADRIFVIFQRLHGRETYSGTGIGLAMGKKIVEFHGGRIWLDVAYGPGTSICFTLPVRDEEKSVDESG